MSDTNELLKGRIRPPARSKTIVTRVMYAGKPCYWKEEVEAYLDMTDKLIDDLGSLLRVTQQQMFQQHDRATSISSENSQLRDDLDRANAEIGRLRGEMGKVLAISIERDQYKATLDKLQQEVTDCGKNLMVLPVSETPYHPDEISGMVTVDEALQVLTEKAMKEQSLDAGLKKATWFSFKRGYDIGKTEVVNLVTSII